MRRSSPRGLAGGDRVTVSLAPAEAPVPTSAEPSPAVAQVAESGQTARAAQTAGDAARHFLLDVMNDEAVALALRIEAARALLQPGR